MNQIGLLGNWIKEIQKISRRKSFSGTEIEENNLKYAEQLISVFEKLKTTPKNTFTPSICNYLTYIIDNQGIIKDSRHVLVNMLSCEITEIRYYRINYIKETHGSEQNHSFGKPDTVLDLISTLIGGDTRNIDHEDILDDIDGESVRTYDVLKERVEGIDVLYKFIEAVETGGDTNALAMQIIRNLQEEYIFTSSVDEVKLTGERDTYIRFFQNFVESIPEDTEYFEEQMGKFISRNEAIVNKEEIDYKEFAPDITGTMTYRKDARKKSKRGFFSKR